jgi:hypothetical protein
MTDKDHIKSLLKEAQIYRKHGLLEESQEKYQELFEKLKSGEKSPQGDAFIDSLQKRIFDIKSEIDEIDRTPRTPELSYEIQQLISHLFAFSGNKDIAAVEGAAALAEFGQYESAIAKYQEQLDKGISPMMVAKNMIRCHLSLASQEAVMNQFKKWKSDHTFSEMELGFLRNFYHEMLRSRTKPLKPAKDKHSNGHDKEFINTLKVQSSIPDEDCIKVEELQDILEISSISLELMQDPGKNRIIEFEITYQLGNTISFIVDANDWELIETFEPGVHLPCVHCFSPVSAFETNGVISQRKKITSGPQKGNYLVRVTLNTP